MNHDALRRRKIINHLQATALMAGMAVLLSLIGWIVAGWEGAAYTVVFGLLFLFFGNPVSPRLFIHVIGARRLTPWDYPVLHQITDELARRAELAHSPALYLVPGGGMQAFTVGNTPSNAAIVLSPAIIEGLSLRELAGVFAHEISHIRGRDIAVMGLADLVTRMTRTLSLLGLLLVVWNVPMAVVGEGGVMPWTALALLVLAPLAGTLMQLALSRTREFEADRTAAMLTGDPVGLASALKKLELTSRGLMNLIFMPRPAEDLEPSLLRTHPATAERVKRLLELEPYGSPLPRHMLRPEDVTPIASGHSGPAARRRFIRWWG